MHPKGRLAVVVLAALAAFVLSSAASAARYIVVFDDSVSNPAARAETQVANRSGELGFVYTHALNGYSAELSPAAAEALRSAPGVAYVEADLPVYATTTQTNATWGLDRIDQRALPLSTTFTYTANGPA